MINVLHKRATHNDGYNNLFGGNFDEEESGGVVVVVGDEDATMGIIFVQTMKNDRNAKFV
jgi:hypothetical protein